MSDKYAGKLMVRVTVSGCGIPIDGANIYIDNKKYKIGHGCDGFSEIIPLTENCNKGICEMFSLKAEAEGFQPLVCHDVPITSGYLTIWNMPLSPKSSKVKKV